MTILTSLIDELRKRDRALAPGSETHLWVEFLARMSRLYGDINGDLGPLDDPELRGVIVADDEVAWWRQAYEALENSPAATFEEIRSAISAKRWRLKKESK